MTLTRQVLSRTIGLQARSDELVVTGALGAGEAPESIDVETLARHTPAYVASIASRSVAEAQAVSARGGYKPDVSLTGSAGRSGDEDASEEDSWSVGLKLSFPLWPGGKTKHEVRKAKAALRESEANAADTLNSVARTLAEAHQSLVN